MRWRDIAIELGRGGRRSVVQLAQAGAVHAIPIHRDDAGHTPPLHSVGAVAVAPLHPLNPVLRLALGQRYLGELREVMRGGCDGLRAGKRGGEARLRRPEGGINAQRRRQVKSVRRLCSSGRTAEVGGGRAVCGGTRMRESRESGAWRSGCRGRERVGVVVVVVVVVEEKKASERRSDDAGRW